jgi:raffinose/stachyose/melibiose transport system substrate-binding protein
MTPSYIYRRKTVSNTSEYENRRRLSRRDFLRLTGGMAGMAALAACAPVAPASPAGPADTPEMAPPVSQVPGELVISISSTLSDEAQESLSRAYREARPDVELVWELPNLDAGQYPQWLGTQIAAGNIRPDIVSGNYFSTFNGYVNFDMYRKMTNPHTGHVWDYDLNFDAYRGQNAFGERTMLPMRAVHTYYFYNQDIFDEVGINTPNTWFEFVDVCRKLSEAGHIPVSANYIWQVPQWISEIYFDQYHVDWVEAVRAQPGDWNFDPELDGAFEFDPADRFIHNKYTYNVQRFYKGMLDGELRFDTPEITEIVDNLSQIFPRHAVEDFFVISNPYPPFLQQQAAIMSNGTWSIPTLLRDMESISPERLEELGIASDVRPFNWGTFENPSMEGDLVKTEAKAVESAPGPYLSIIEKNQEQVDRALEFVMFWTSAPGYTAFMQGEIAAGTFSPAGPLMISGVEEPPEYAALWEDLEFKGNAEINYNGFWTSGAGGDFQTDIRNMLKESLEGATAPQTHANQLQNYVERHLPGMVERVGLTMEDVRNPARQPGT